MPAIDERSVILTVQRSGRVRPMSADLKPREGDVASVAIHIPDRPEALAALAAQGWIRVLPAESEQDRA